MTYRRRDSPLHAARAAVGAGFCAALAAVTLLVGHPLVLAAVGVAALAVGAACGVGPEQRRPLLFVLPLAVLAVAINALLAPQGVTVLWRFGELPLVGRLDVTLEGMVAGAVLALRLVVLVLCTTLLAAAVDPDELLRALRRRSSRWALTAALAVRLVPVLARDGRRLADARRCRPPGSPAADDDRGTRARVLRAVVSSALERSVDLAATLELRGFGLGGRPPRSRAPWSRHDRSFAVAAAALVGLAVLAALATSFSADPRLAASGGVATWGCAAAIVAVALLPCADRRGIVR